MGTLFLMKGNYGYELFRQPLVLLTTNLLSPPPSTHTRAHAHMRVHTHTRARTASLVGVD